MKKTIFISIGVLITLILLGVWVYLFMYGAPKNAAEVFARFGITGNEEITPVPLEDTYIDVSTETSTEESKKLRQLTLRPVAGSAFADSGIRYVEQGTGHIYHIDLTTGEEVLLNGTTIPQTSKAVFSPDGSYVAITSFSAVGEVVMVENANANEQKEIPMESVTLPQGAREVAFGMATGTLNYLLDTTSGSAGYQYNFIKETSVRSFNIPLRDVRVLWGVQNYVYTTPTALQEGHLYKITDDSLTYAAESGYGLTGFQYNLGVVVTKTTNSKVQSIANSQNGAEITQSLVFIPEKCAINPVQSNASFCAMPNNFGNEMFPDAWYMGSLSYSDVLWDVDIQTGRAVALSDFKTESGREIDVIQIGVNTEGNRIWFINKNDNTLWMFDTSLQ